MAEQEKKPKPAVIMVVAIPCSTQGCQHRWNKSGYIISDEDLEVAAGKWPSVCPQCKVEQSLPSVFATFDEAKFDLRGGTRKHDSTSPIGHYRNHGRYLSAQLLAEKTKGPVFYSTAC